MTHLNEGGGDDFFGERKKTRETETKGGPFENSTLVRL